MKAQTADTSTDDRTDATRGWSQTSNRDQKDSWQRKPENFNTQRKPLLCYKCGEPSLYDNSCKGEKTQKKVNKSDNYPSAIELVEASNQYFINNTKL